MMYSLPPFAIRYPQFWPGFGVSFGETRRCVETMLEVARRANDPAFNWLELPAFVLVRAADKGLLPEGFAQRAPR